MMPSTFTSAEVTALVATLLQNVRVAGGIEDGAYSLAEVAERCNIAPSGLIKDCQADRIEHVHKGDSRSMTPTQVAKMLRQYTRGGVTQQSTVDQPDVQPDVLAQARQASQAAAKRATPRKKAA